MEMNKNWCYCDGDGRLDKSVSRRAMLAGAATAGVWWLSAKSALAQASMRKGGEDGNVVVVVFLRGGADGLNVVAPYGEDEYYRLRPSLALKSPKTGVGVGEKLIDLDGFFGFNPALQPLEGDFKEGTLAVVHAVGSGDESHSHFEAMNTMERGWTDQKDNFGGGWLARHLNMTEGSGSPLRGVAISSVLPDSLLGATSALAVERISDYRLQSESPELRAALRAVYQGQNDAMGKAGNDTWNVLDALNKVDPSAGRPDGGAVYPDTPVGNAFKEVAYLIKLDMGLEVACLDAGGWDTHVTQGTTDGWMYGLLDDLAKSIQAFQKDVGSLMSKTTVVVQSEFGRRVHENSGLGTDHGTGGCMMVLGAGVRGGKIYADWPGLVPDKQVGPGDLKTTTDYRSVLMDVVENRLGNARAGEVFPGFVGRGLGVVGA